MHMESKKDFVQLLKTSFQNEYKISDAQSFSSCWKIKYRLFPDLPTLSVWLEDFPVLNNLTQSWPNERF